jgi:predicted MFS family arabinose efflux permease
MSKSFALTTTLTAPKRATRLSTAATFYLQASITLLFLAGSSAPTPLYPLYQRLWGFSTITVTIVFGIYAVAVLAALLITGRLSDHIGRRPVLLATTLLQALAMLVLGTADGVTGLLIGRILQGLATGAAVSAVGAGLIDLDKARGTIANSIAPIMGTAVGGLVGGMMVHFLPAPTHLVYALFGVLFILQCAGVSLMPDTISRLPGALASLKPQFALPSQARAPMLIAIPVLVASWALAGFYAAIAPALIAASFHLDASLYGGISLFVLAASGALTVLLLRNATARVMMLFGTAGLFVGVGLVLAATSIDSVALFAVGSIVTGAGFGSGFQGAIRTVVPLALPHERAGVLSVAFVVSYLSMGLPAVAAGFALANGASFLETARVFGGLVMALSVAALAGTLMRRAPPVVA